MHREKDRSFIPYIKGFPEEQKDTNQNNLTELKCKLHFTETRL